MTQTKSSVCSRCGNPRSSALPGDACPHCLMALGMGGAPAETTANPPSFLDQGHVPPIEKLVAVFPDLEIEHLVGHGGMGAVYQARQTNLDRVVALKILSPRLSSDPAFAERFIREARMLAKLSHPNIVTVFDFGQAGEYYYLTMEFVDGVNLRDTITANLLSPVEALAIVPQICEALQYAHDHGVVHRDIKPENILIAKNGSIKIADFGLAKLLAATPDQFTLTGTRQVLGTRNYMAPEQIESPDVVDHRADLYALGVVFYELLTGELPLGRFALPSEKSASISGQLDDVVMRTLEKDPNRRFQQASQIKTACESLNEPRRKSPDPVSAPFESEGQPLCPPFPIIIEDIFAGFASGYGMLRAFESNLEVEFEIRDSVMDHKWSSSRVRIPLERITAIKLHNGLFYTHLTIQADRFETVNEIPNSKHGSFRVYLKRRYRESAELLVHQVNERMSHAFSPPASPPMPPRKFSGFVPVVGSGKNSGSSLAAILLFLFLGFGSLVAVVVVAGSVWMTTRQAPSVAPVAVVEVAPAVPGPSAAISTTVGAAASSAQAIEQQAESNDGGSTNGATVIGTSESGATQSGATEADDSAPRVKAESEADDDAPEKR